MNGQNNTKSGHISFDATNNNNKLDEEDFDRQNNIITTHTQINNNSHRNRILESKFSKRSSTIAFNNTNNIDIGVDYINLIFSSSSTKQSTTSNQYLNEMVQLRKGVKLR